MVSMLRPAAVGITAITLMLGVACSATTANTGTNLGSTNTTSSNNSTQNTSAPAPAKKTSGSYTTADLVKYAEPAVVRIQTNSGVGTGFFVTDDGYIMTNNHVIATASGRGTSTNIQITLDDGSTKTAKVVGTDAKADLALLKIDGSGYTALKLASLENVNVGDDVIAIGFALDLSNGGGQAGSSPGAPSVTQGIVSAKNRGIDETSNIVLGSIQTDAAINHGNSGGPLIDFNGEVVGINTSLVPDTESGTAASGIGLAVGSDTINAVFQELKANGVVNRGLLGIQQFQSLRPSKSKDLGVPPELGGIYLPTDAELGQNSNVRQTLSSVAPGGPADQAGIKPGDVITKLADTSVHDESELAVALIKHHPGEKVTVEIYRGGKKMDVQVTLGTPPAN
jgi:S1-C subfamily serine protease